MCSRKLRKQFRQAFVPSQSCLARFFQMLQNTRVQEKERKRLTSLRESRRLIPRRIVLLLAKMTQSAEHGRQVAVPFRADEITSPDEFTEDVATSEFLLATTAAQSRLTRFNGYGVTPSVCGVVRSLESNRSCSIIVRLDSIKPLQTCRRCPSRNG